MKDNIKPEAVQSLILIVVSAILVLLPLSGWIANKMSLELPAWLDGKTAEYLSGITDKEGLLEDPRAIIEEFKSGKFQTRLENKLLAHTPMRAQALMVNAALERMSIEVSNCLWNWPAYPTFYGSSYVVVNEGRSLMPIRRSGYDAGWIKFAKQLAGFASSHKNVNIAVVVPSETMDPVSNPALNLVSDSDTVDEFAAILEEILGNTGNVEVVIADYDSNKEYWANYFNTDHHWTVLGAVTAYNLLAERWGMNALEVEGIRYFDIGFMGSQARGGLIPLNDEAFDVINDMSSLRIVKSDGEAISGSDHNDFYNTPELKKFFDFHTARYGNVEEIVNESNPDGLNTLLICDSFGSTFIRPFAMGAHKISLRDYLLRDKRGEKTAEQLLAETKNSSIVFLGTPWNYATFLERNPEFFL